MAEDEDCGGSLEEVGLIAESRQLEEPVSRGEGEGLLGERRTLRPEEEESRGEERLADARVAGGEERRSAARGAGAPAARPHTRARRAAMILAGPLAVKNLSDKTDIASRAPRGIMTGYPRMLLVNLEWIPALA